jgi:hypothetical protein
MDVLETLKRMGFDASQENGEIEIRVRGKHLYLAGMIPDFRLQRRDEDITLPTESFTAHEALEFEQEFLRVFETQVQS